MIYGFLLGLHLLICVTLILVVLLQSGKGGGLAGAFGGLGGTGQTLFGGRGAATFLSKATTVLGIAFMMTSLLLALMAGAQSGPRSVIREAQGDVTTAPPSSAQPLQMPGDAGLPAPGSDAGAAPIQLPTGESPAAQPAPGAEQPQTTPPPAGGTPTPSPAAGGGN